MGLRVCYYGATSPTRELVCNLHLLFDLASAVFLGSVSCWTHRHIYSLNFEITQTWRAKFLYLFPPGAGWPSYTTGHWVAEV
jgi:hypothetical protein